MKTTLTKLAVLLAGLALVGCVSTTCPTHHKPVTTMTETSSTTETISSTAPEKSEDQGIARNGMDSNDKYKLSHALDKAPGKPTHWVNASSGITYTVLPIRPVTIDGNSNCRKYSITSMKGTQSNQSFGTACVGDDSSWKAVN